MIEDIEETIRQEIARRAFEKANLDKQKAETRYTLDALEEMTGLSRAELEAIEKAVRADPPQEPDEFFSVKHQLIIAAIILLIVFVLLIM